MSLARMMQMAAAGSAGAEPSGWTDPDLANASYDSVSLDISSVSGAAPDGIQVKDNGLKLYVASNTNDKIHQWNLSTANDLSSASYYGYFSTTSQTSNPGDVFFKNDGTKMYIADNLLEDIYQYSLSTAWDITTATYDSKSFSPSEPSVGSSIFISTDGTKLYYENYSTETTYQYNLSTAWDISTASYASKSFTSTEAADIYGIFFNPDGDKLYKISLTTDAVYQYSLSTAWDVSTASYDSISFSVASQSSIAVDFCFAEDGSKMFVLDTAAPDAIYQYSTSAAAPAEWIDPDLANASYDSVSFSVAGQDGGPTGLFFKTDGTKMYMVGFFNDNVSEYNLSTAWDVSSASSLQSFSVSAQDAIPQSLFFKPDGSKMYVVGSFSDSVHEYDLSIDWDVSTASYVQGFSVATQETGPTSLFFKPDGTKMYVAGSSGDDVNEYDLSTAWNVSTASFVQNFSVSTQETFPQDLFFNPDGTKMFVLGSTGDDVNEYNLSTAWDVSTSSYLQNFSVVSQLDNPTGFFFKSDGSKMYVVGTTTDTIYQYSTA